MSKKKARESVSIVERFFILRRDKHTCQYCGCRAPDVQLHIDHIVPVALGGGNDLVNLITSCVRCNLGKSDWDGVTDEKRGRTERERRLEAELNFAERRESWGWWASFVPGCDVTVRAMLHAICREADAAGSFSADVNNMAASACLPVRDAVAIIRGLEATGIILPSEGLGTVLVQEGETYTAMGDIHVDFAFQRGGAFKPPYAMDDYVNPLCLPSVERVYG